MPKSCVIIIRFEMAGDILILTSSTGKHTPNRICQVYQITDYP